MATPRDFGIPINMNQQEILNAVFHLLPSAPTSALEGQYYYNSTDKSVYFYDGTSFKLLGGITDIQAAAGFSSLSISIVNGVATLDIAIADATNKGLMSNTDKVKLDASTSANTADALVQRDSSGNIAVNEIIASKITGLTTPTNGTDAVNKTYVDTLVDGSLKTPEAYDPTLTSAYPTTYEGNAIQSGDTFRITAAGTMGSVDVNPEDLLIALVDNPGQTDSNWQIAESNRDQSTETVKGVARLATQVEVDSGTDDTTIVTPLKLATKLQNFTRKVTFTGVQVGNTPGPQSLNHNLNTSSIIISVIDETTLDKIEISEVRTNLNTLTVDKNGSTKTVTVTIQG